MKKWYSHVIWPGLILFIIGVVFYFDKTLPIGTDNSFYMDLSALISRGGKFLIDFFDYRTPLFPLLFSPIYKMGFSDFTNRFFMLFSVYSFYCLALYFISFSLTRSLPKSWLAVLLVFVSISSRQFDPGRDIAVPLFYHTLELISLFLLFSVIIADRIRLSSKKIILYSVFSGILWATAFIGRQVHIAVPLIIGGFVIYWLYKKRLGQAATLATTTWKPRFQVVVAWLAGFGLFAVLALWIFYVPGVGYLSLLKKWLIEIPPIIYKAEPLRITKKFITTLYWGLPAIRNIFLPLYWTTYLLSAASMAVFFFSDSAQAIGSKLRFFYQQNKKIVLFVWLVGFMAVATVLTTGSGAKSHEAPFFTLYFFILILVLNNIGLQKYLRNWWAGLFIAIFLLPQAIDFAKKEIKIHIIDRGSQEVVSFPERVADKLKTLIKTKDPVLVLGAYPTIARLVDYKPFMGQNNDIFLYSGQKLFGEKYQENLLANLAKVNTAYQLIDYPNLNALSGLREDKTNEIYLYIENNLQSKFEVAAIIEQDEFKRVTIYRRKK
ncbi:MAG: hypothetical protein G01um101444_121 [Parcubacteria group bacterium Gr01-1014_44]|nr:MAG: hypothetical protein G01um101444_121 [Parcubacteria group bacterium Gr01-1014_44]